LERRLYMDLALVLAWGHHSVFIQIRVLKNIMVMYQQNNFFLKFIQVPVRRFLLLLQATDRDTTLVIALNSQSCFGFAGT